MSSNNKKQGGSKLNTKLSLEILCQESWQATSAEVVELLTQVKKVSLQKTHNLKGKYSKYKQMARSLAEILSAKDSKIEQLEQVIVDKENKLVRMKSAVKNMNEILKNMIGYFKSGLEDTKQMVIELSGKVMKDYINSYIEYADNIKIKEIVNNLEGMEGGELEEGLMVLPKKRKLESEVEQKQMDVVFENKNDLLISQPDGILPSQDDLQEVHTNQYDINFVDTTMHNNFVVQDILAAEKPLKSIDAEPVQHQLKFINQYPSWFLRKQQCLNQLQNNNRFLEGSESSDTRRSSSICSQSIFSQVNREKSRTFDQKSSQNSIQNSKISNSLVKQQITFNNARRHKSDDFSNSPQATFLSPLKRVPIVNLHSQSLPQQNQHENNVKLKRAVFPMYRQSYSSVIDYYHHLERTSPKNNNSSSVSSLSQSPSQLRSQPISKNITCLSSLNCHNNNMSRSCNGSVSSRNIAASTGSKWGALFAELSQLSISELKRQAFKDKSSNQSSPNHNTKELRTSIYKTKKQSFSEVISLLQQSEIFKDNEKQHQPK